MPNEKTVTTGKVALITGVSIAGKHRPLEPPIVVHAEEQIIAHFANGIPCEPHEIEVFTSEV